MVLVPTGGLGFAMRLVLRMGGDVTGLGSDWTGLDS